MGNWNGEEFTDYLAPSRMCGEALGIPEIWCDWGLHSHAELQAQIGRPWTDHWDRDLALWVVGHAPQLLPLCGGDVELYDVALGMVSQFVEDDIRYFLQFRHWRTRPGALELRYQALYDVLGPLMQWVPSRPTLELIEARVDSLKLAIHQGDEILRLTDEAAEAGMSVDMAQVYAAKSRILSGSDL